MQKGEMYLDQERRGQSWDAPEVLTIAIVVEG